MTEAEKNEIVGLVMTQISSQAVDFDIATEEPKANDLLTAVRETESGGYRGVTIKWDDVARIATELANQSAKRAEQAKTDANNILEQVQSKGTEITNFVATSKAELETQKNESVNAVKSVYQTDLNELKGDLGELNHTVNGDVLIGKNKFNPYTLIEGYQIDTNGSLMERSEFITSDFIDVIDGATKVVASYVKSDGSQVELSGYFCFYDSAENRVGNLIGGSTASVPQNAKKMRYCSPINGYGESAYKRVQIEFADEFTSYEPYSVTKINGIKDIVVNINTIEVGSGKTFTNIVDAIESIEDSCYEKRYTILLYEGTYDTVVPSKISNGYVGLIIPDYVSIKGIGKRDNIIIRGNIASEYVSFANYISTINLMMNGTVENVTITAKNIKYCNHDDSGTIGLVKSSHTFKHVKFIHYGVDIEGHNVNAPYMCGIGSQKDKEVIFDACEFVTYNGKYSIIYHDNSANENGGRLVVKNCIFKSNVYTGTDCIFLSNSWGGITSFAEIYGNSLYNGIKIGAPASVNRNCWRVVAWGNNGWRVEKEGLDSVDITGDVFAYCNN